MYRIVQVFSIRSLWHKASVVVLVVVVVVGGAPPSRSEVQGITSIGDEDVDFIALEDMGYVWHWLGRGTCLGHVKFVADLHLQGTPVCASYGRNGTPF